MLLQSLPPPVLLVLYLPFRCVILPKRQVLSSMLKVLRPTLALRFPM